MYRISDDPLDWYEDNEPYDALQIANWYISRAKRDDRDLSILALLKLCYIAHGKHLAKYDEPLFPSTIQAWQYGPVIYDIYGVFKKQRLHVSQPFEGIPEVERSSDVEKLLEEVWQEYNHLPPFKLSELTHEPGSPWDIARRRFGWYAPISNELIKQHYVEMVAKHG